MSLALRNFDEENITEAVVAQMPGAKSERARKLSEALVRALHGFIREIEPSFAEWLAGIEFLTAVGAKCTANRQEFILLSDTLGASMLVDAINHRLPEGATETTVLGPFFVANAPEMPLGADISHGAPGEPLLAEGRVTNSSGAPVAGAIVDVWHSDQDGFYDVQRYDQGGPVSFRARLRTDADGRYRFWSIVPKFYSIPADGPVGAMLREQGRHPFRPAHVHFMIAAPGCETLVTHVFIAGDPYLDSDVVFGVKDSLVKALEARPAGSVVDGRSIPHAFKALRYDFALAPALKG